MAAELSEPLHLQVIHAREHERKQIARDLHDQIIQSLIGLNYQLLDMRRNCAAETGPYLNRLQSDLHQMIEDVRRICVNLRPPAFEHLDLVPGIRAQARELECQGSYRVALEIDDATTQPVPQPMAICLYRIVQEALINVRKHANASAVTIRLTLSDTLISLTIEDNGDGFTVPPQLDHLLNGRHFGLVGVREQLESVKGSLHISSALGLGTLLQATIVPLPAAISHTLPAREIYV